MEATLAALSTLTRHPVAAVAGAIGPVLAATLGLSFAGFAEAALGRLNPVRVALTATLCGAFVSSMTAGYFSTLAFGALFAAGLAALAHGIRRPGRRPVVAAGVLVGAAGLAHPVFSLLAAPLLTGGIGALLWNRLRKGDKGAFVQTAAARALAAVAVACLVLLAGLVAVEWLAHAPIPHSGDAILRLISPHASLARKFRGRFYGALRWATTYGVTGVLSLGLLAAVGLAARRRESPPSAWFFWAVVGTWSLVTVAGAAALMGGIGAPAQRLVNFCVPLPILTGLALSLLWTHKATWALKLLARAAVILCVVVLVGHTWRAWRAEKPTRPARAVAQIRNAAAAGAQQPTGTPLIVVTEGATKPRGDAAAVSNYFLDMVPPRRAGDVHIFFGSPGEFLARRPTTMGGVQGRQLSKWLMSDLRPALRRPAVAVVLRSLDRREYREAVRLPGHRRVAPGVATLPAFPHGRALSVTPSGAAADPPGLGSGPLSPWLPVALGPVVMAVLAAIGWSWAGAAMPFSEAGVRASLAPAFGLGALALVSIAADAVGLRLDGVGAWVSAVVALVGGVAVDITLRRRGSRTVASDVQLVSAGGGYIP
jgi:hypothetical protein